MTRIRTERGFWAHVKERAPGFWLRMENSARPGTPDCCVLLHHQVIWVELKRLDKWTPTMGLSALQYMWLKQWAKHGGKAGLFACVGNEFTFIWGQHILRQSTEIEWRRAAAAIWPDQIDWIQLEELLTNAPFPN